MYICGFSYAILLQTYSILKYFEERKWINPFQQVLKRKVNFIKNTDDAIAEICVLDQANDGNVELVGNRKVCCNK